MRAVPAIDTAVMAFGSALWSTPADACTLCHGQVGAEAHAAMFWSGFWGDAATLLAPVPLLIGAVIAMRRYLP